MSTLFIQRSVTACLAVVLGIYAAAGCTSENGGTEPGPTPAITLTVSPGNATIAPGGSADVTGTLTRSGGFTGAVVLTVEGAPAGVSGSISNESTSGGVTTATITITVAANATPGTYTLTVRGTGSGVSDATATFTLTVSGFVITLTPSTLSVNQGDQGISEVGLTRTSFNGTVALSLEGAPTGITGTFDPTPAPGSSSTLTIAVDAGVAVGEYSLTVRGTATGQNDQTATLALTVAEQPDYSLAADPNAFSIEQGMSGQSAIAITRTNFTGAVTLSLGGAPAGMTGTFDPAAPTDNASTLTIDVDVSVAPGVYNLTVDGQSTIGDRSTPLTVTVTEAPASYTMTLTPDALTIEQDDAGTVDVALSRINFSGAVALTLEGAPTGVTSVFNPAAPTGDASTLTLNVGAATVPGVYTLTVRGTAAGLADRTATLTLTVGNFSISVDPNALTIQQGMSDQSTVTISGTNFTGEVSLSLSGAPAGVTGDFDPQATTGTTSTLTVSVDSATVPGTYELTVVGSSGSGSAPGVSAAVDMEATLTLTVEEIPDYSLGVEPPSLTIEQGMSGQAAVSISRTNFDEAVTLSLGGAPAGITGTFDPAAPTGNSSTVTVAVDATVAAGEYNLTIDGDASIGMRSTPLTVTVTEAPDFSLSLDPAALSIEQGMNGQTTVTIARTNFTGDVTLSLENAPSGITGAFNPNPATGTTSTLTVSVDAGVATGTYNLRVDGVGDPGTRSANLDVTVTAPPPGFTLSMTPSGATVAQGGATSGTININRTGGFAESVTLSVSGMPSGMTATPTPSGTTGNSATLDVSVGSGVTPGTYVLTVAGNATGFPQETTTFTVTVTMTGGGTTIMADFSSCSMDEKPVWFAFQDGTGSWMQVMGVMDVYTVTFNASKGGVVWLIEDGMGDRVLNVIYATVAEFATLSADVCDPPGTKTVNFTVAGMDMGDLATAYLGDTPASSFIASDGAYDFLEVPAGPQNLLAFKSMAGDPSMNAKVIVRRGLDIADMGDAGLVDFNGTDAAVPETGSVTVAGLVGGELTGGSFSFASAGSCQVAALHGVSGASFDVHAPAASQRIGSDRLVTVVSAVDPMLSDRSRGVTDIRSTVGGFTITLPPEMPAPTVAPLIGGNYLRLEGMADLAAEYSGFALFAYANTDSDRAVSLSATAGYLESLTATLGLDDFTGVSGWMDDYAPATTDMAEWSFIGFGGGFLDDECTATSYGTASRSGTFP